MKRKSGYYWVKLQGEWVIAYWSIPCWADVKPNWYLFDRIRSIEEKEFEEIDERKIERL